MIKIVCCECGIDLTKEWVERLSGSIENFEDIDIVNLPELEDPEGTASEVLFPKTEITEISEDDEIFLIYAGAMLVYALTSTNHNLCKTCWGPIAARARKKLMKRGKPWGKPLGTQ